MQLEERCQKVLEKNRKYINDTFCLSLVLKNESFFHITKPKLAKLLSSSLPNMSFICIYSPNYLTVNGFTYSASL